jgi:membrane protease YdiL (CAAX protease family)
VPDWLLRALWAPDPSNQIVAASALVRRRAVTVGMILVGAIVLGVSLRIEPGSIWFYPSTMVLAAVWAAGAFASGPLHLGRISAQGELKRPIVSPVLIGLALAAAFALGALVVREIPVLEEQVSDVLAHAERGSGILLVLVTIVNGIAEELFFRGAVYASVPRRPVLISTVAYALTTCTTGNAMLTFAAVLLGAVVGLERRASGGILAPILTHVTWALAMLAVLPLLVS